MRWNHLPIDVIGSALHRPVREFRRRIRSIGAEGADGSPRILAEDVLEIHDRRHAARGRLPHQRGRRQFLMLYHVGGGAVRERLAGLPGVIRDVLVDVVDVAGRREGVRVLPVGVVGGLGYLPVRGHAVLEVTVLVLQGTVAAARIVGRTRLLTGPVAPVRILQRGVSRRVAATVAAVAARFLDVHLLTAIAIVVICRRVWHRLQKNSIR